MFAGTRPDDPRSAAADLAEIRRSCSGAGVREGTARLADLLGAPDSTVRTRAATALGRVGGMNAEAPLTAALSDQVAEVRLQAVDALRRVAGARAIPALQGLLLRDPDPGVRRAAARTLGMLRDHPPRRRSPPPPRTLMRLSARKSRERSGAMGGGPVMGGLGRGRHRSRRRRSWELRPHHRSAGDKLGPQQCHDEPSATWADSFGSRLRDPGGAPVSAPSILPHAGTRGPRFGGRAAAVPVAPSGERTPR